MKRILFYTYEYPPLGGGIANAVAFLMKEFAKENDLAIDIITSSLDNKWASRPLSERIRMYTVPIGVKKDSLHKQTPLNMVLYMIGSFARTVQLLSRNKYDLAHVFGYPGAFVSFLFSWRLPYIVSLRGVDVPGYNPKFAVIDRLYKPLVRLVWKKARRVIANSKKFAELAKKTAPDLRIEVIPNGVDCEMFKPTTQKFDKFTVTAGATLMGPKKGLTFLLEGFSLFARDKQDVRLLLIGSGSMEGELKALAARLGISAKVTFMGRQEKDWIAAHLPKCHVFCLPSLNEGMSNATLEAMACGLPIIITDTGGSDELVQGNGFVIRKGDPEAIADCINKLYEDKATREQKGVRSRGLAESFSWARVAELYVDTYTDV